MKAVWSVVLGIVMVLGQYAAAASNGTGAPVLAACECSSCAQFNCCDTTSPSTPLAPPAASSADFRVQAPAPTVVAVLSAPEPASSSIVSLFCDRSLSQRAALPVYERNCSYLI